MKSISNLLPISNLTLNSGIRTATTNIETNERHRREGEEKGRHRRSSVSGAIYYENNKILGYHYCPGKNPTELGFDFAHRKVLRDVFNFIVTSNHKEMIFYRTSTPHNFENEIWLGGGNCKRIEPVKEGVFELNKMVKIIRDI
ncbi:unnamed protein product [Ilex paraguariensis]|uniref:Trichome birefringence-like C-terminal domain-containing protein n=1 Tax=Ilex paraguariensis TaxID=185542 RepID=A0ABC8QM02_9AQUA